MAYTTGVLTDRPTTMTSQMRQVSEVTKALADLGINNLRDAQAVIRWKQERDGIPSTDQGDSADPPKPAPSQSKTKRVDYINANASMKELQQSLTMIVTKLMYSESFREVVFGGRQPSMMDVRRWLESMAQVDFYNYDSESPLLRGPCLRQIEKGLEYWEDYGIESSAKFEVVYDMEAKS